MVMQQKTDVIEWYRRYDESARMFSSPTRKLEYLTTLHYLDQFISKDDNVLELGAGGGAYTAYLAKRGNGVLATDLVPEYVAVLAEQFAGLTNVETAILDADHLETVEDRQFDAVLCLGPMYHLPMKKQRVRLMCNVGRLLRAGGCCFVSYVNKHYAMSLYLKYRKFFNASEYEAFAENNYAALSHHDKFMDLSYYTTPSEIEDEVSQNGLEVLCHAATDGYYNLIGESIAEMTEEMFADFSRYHLTISQEPSVLGLSSHGLLICRKPLH